MSLAIWDHTVLPSTRHKRTHPACTQFVKWNFGNFLDFWLNTDLNNTERRTVFLWQLSFQYLFWNKLYLWLYFDHTVWKTRFRLTYLLSVLFNEVRPHYFGYFMWHRMSYAQAACVSLHVDVNADAVQKLLRCHLLATDDQSVCHRNTCSAPHCHVCATSYTSGLKKISVLHFHRAYVFTARHHSLVCRALYWLYPSVCLSVCHTLALCQNDSSYNHGVFTVG